MDREKLKPHDVQRASDLVKLPLLTKEIIRTNQNNLMSLNISQMKVTWSKTGGTTGEPMQICRNREAGAWANMCHERGLTWAGMKPDDRRVSLFGGSLGVGVNRPSLVKHVSHLLRRDLFLPAFELRADTVGSYFDTIKRSKCRFLVGYTSAIYRLAKLAEERNEDIRFTAVFPTAEILLPEWEEVIGNVFKCPVVPYYGCGEINALGYYRHQRHYSVPDEHVIIEVMQKDGSASLSGDGRFILTDLDNYAMPVIRYLNGDAGQISVYSDSDSPFTQIDRLDGRFNSFLMTDNGDLISGAMGPHIFRLFPSVSSYQIVQEDPLTIIIQIVPKAEFSEHDKQSLLCIFGRHLGSKMKILIQLVSHIAKPPSGKTMFVINRCL
jgi:phenylacetate-CoA ligase